MAHLRVVEGRGAPSVEAIEKLYRARYHRFLRVAEAVAGDLERGRDAVQEGFASAIRHRVDYRGEGSLESWVWSCVINAARAARRERELPQARLPESSDNGHWSPKADLRKILALLPERQRLVVFLRYYADLDYRSIADVLGIEIGTVGATLSKAQQALRQALEEVPR